MDRNSILQIIEGHITKLEGNSFQDFCDRFCLVLFPNDYTPVRAAGNKGDMKNDGYCPKARIFFQAHATRGEQLSKTKKKIEDDLQKCTKLHSNLKKWIYLTNDTLVGDVESFVDLLRDSYSSIIIETWSLKKIALKINKLSLNKIEQITGINFKTKKTKIIAAESNITSKYIEELLNNSTWTRSSINYKDVWICDSNLLVQIEHNDDYEDFSESWSRTFPDRLGSKRFSVSLKVSGVTIKQFYFVYCDGGRITVPLPEFTISDTEKIDYFFWDKSEIYFKVAKIVSETYIYGSLEKISSITKIKIIDSK